MTRSEFYNARAADCLRLANRTQDMRRRSMFLNMNECWSALEARAFLAEDGVRLDTGTPLP
jgi:hypothetical protein